MVKGGIAGPRVISKKAGPGRGNGAAFSSSDAVAAAQSASQLAASMNRSTPVATSASGNPQVALNSQKIPTMPSSQVLQIQVPVSVSAAAKIPKNVPTAVTGNATPRAASTPNPPRSTGSRAVVPTLSPALTVENLGLVGNIKVTTSSRRLFGDETQRLMHAFGDARYGLREVLDLVEDAVRELVKRVVVSCSRPHQKSHQYYHLTAEAMLASIASDPRAFHRLNESLKACFVDFSAAAASGHAASQGTVPSTDALNTARQPNTQPQQQAPRPLSTTAANPRAIGLTQSAPVNPAYVPQFAVAAMTLKTRKRMSPHETNVERIEALADLDDIDDEGTILPPTVAEDGLEVEDDAELKDHHELSKVVSAASASVIATPSNLAAAGGLVQGQQQQIGTTPEDPALICASRANFAVKRSMPRHQYADLCECRSVSFVHDSGGRQRNMPRLVLFREWLDIPLTSSAPNPSLLPKAPFPIVADDAAICALGHFAWEAVGLITQTALLIKYYDDDAGGRGDARVEQWTFARHLLTALRHGVSTAVVIPLDDTVFVQLRTELDAVEARWKGLGLTLGAAGASSNLDSSTSLCPWHIEEALRRLGRPSGASFGLAPSPLYALFGNYKRKVAAG